MEGRPENLSPQFIMKSEGSWLGRSVNMERITQRSSAWPPSCGKMSLISMPLCPYFLKVKGDCSRLPVLRSVLTLPAGAGLPLYFASIGLGSKVSTCDGPPLRQRKMTCLALAGKCGALGARGFNDAGDKVEALSVEASPARPKPVP